MVCAPIFSLQCFQVEYESKHCYNNGTFIFSEPFYKVVAHFIDVPHFETILPQMFQVGIHCY
jgi:hypothetical protein